MNKHSQSSRGRTDSAFTWAEFLVASLILALFVGVLVPVFRSACAPSKTAIDHSNLRQIGVALVAYASDHNGILPQHPKAISEYFEDPSILRSVCISPYQEKGAVLDQEDSVEPVARYGGYIFLNLGANLEDMDNPKDTILAYTAKVSPKQADRNVLFADGHAEQWEDAKLRAALPPDVDVDALDGP
ncbi:MAG: hypothetical protein R3C45_15100 [Phycisphaerales bacterium]